jgi:hypothetical protein
MIKNLVLFNKTLVIGIFILFIGMSVVSSTGNTTMKTNFSVINTKMGSPTVLLDENFSGIFPPGGWETNTFEQNNSICCDSEPPCIRWKYLNQSQYGEPYITSKAIDASNYEKCIIKFYFGAYFPFGGYNYVYLKYRRNETSSWIDITPWTDPLYEVCDYFETEITYGSEGCGEALQLNWSANGYYYLLVTICFDDVKVFGIPINNPPTAPTIKGETSGKAGKEYEYTFNATDPDDDDVKYYINWGDNTTYETDFNTSSTDVIVKHNWAENGTYNVTAKAEDINGAEGPEKTLTVKITIPRSRTLNYSLLQRMFERFPLLERLLSLII